MKYSFEDIALNISESSHRPQWRKGKDGYVFTVHSLIKGSDRTAIYGRFQRHTLHVETKGEGAVYIIRDGKFGCIAKSDTAISGEVRSGDVYLFCSMSLDDLTVIREFFQSIKETDAAQIKTSLIELLSTHAHSKMFSGVIVSVADRKTRVKLHFNISFGGIRKASRKIVSKLLSLTSFFKGLSRKKQLLIGAGLLLAVMLAGSIISGTQMKKKTERALLVENAIHSVSDVYQEAVLLADLNPVRARELLTESKAAILPLLDEVAPDTQEYQMLQEWVEKISIAEETAYQVYKLNSVPLFFDITLIKNGGEGEVIAAYRQSKAILDTKNRVVYLLQTDTKQSEILAGPGTVKNARTITIHGANVYIFNEDGVVSIDRGSKKTRVVIPKDDAWGDIPSIASFAGNIYLLDRTNRTVWKYTAAEEGFSEKQQYVDPGDGALFAEGMQLVIDGSVWVVTPRRLLQFTQGIPKSFEPSGVTDSIVSIDRFSTSETDKRVYILDKTLNRILVLDKEGGYNSQYQWQELGKATDFLASEEEKKLFVMIGSKIYGIELK